MLPARHIITCYLKWYSNNIRHYRGDFSFCLDAESLLPHQELHTQHIFNEYSELCHSLNLTLDFPSPQQKGELSKETWLNELFIRIAETQEKALNDLYNKNVDYLAQVVFLAMSEALTRTNP